MRNKMQYQKKKTIPRWEKKKWKTNKDLQGVCLHGNLIISAAWQGCGGMRGHCFAQMATWCDYSRGRM